MLRERVLKSVMIVAGLLCVAGIYPLVASLWFWHGADDIVPMFLSLYVTLGVFLLVAARNPSGHRSLILFVAWSSFAHTAVMLIQAYDGIADRPLLFGMSAILVLIGVPLVVLGPAKPAVALSVATNGLDLPSGRSP